MAIKINGVYLSIFDSLMKFYWYPNNLVNFQKNIKLCKLRKFQGSFNNELYCNIMKTIRIKRIRNGRSSGIHHFRHVITLKKEIHEHEVIQHMISWKAFHKNRVIMKCTIQIGLKLLRNVQCQLWCTGVKQKQSKLP